MTKKLEKFYCSIASIEDSAKELATSLMVNGAKYLNQFRNYLIFVFPEIRWYMIKHSHLPHIAWLQKEIEISMHQRIYYALTLILRTVSGRNCLLVTNILVCVKGFQWKWLQLALRAEIFIQFLPPFLLTGVCHFDDCSYYSRTITSGDLDIESDEWKTIERMCEIFTTFARVGDPNNDLMKSIEWKPVTFGAANQTEYNYKCLNISSEVSYIEWPEARRMKVRDEILEYLSRNIRNWNFLWEMLKKIQLNIWILKDFYGFSLTHYMDLIFGQ